MMAIGMLASIELLKPNRLNILLEFGETSVPFINEKLKNEYETF